MLELKESLHQLLACEDQHWGERFYARLFQLRPESQEFFRGTNLHFQAHILLNSLQMVVALAEYNFPAAKGYLKVIGHRHYQKQIPADLFPPFRDAMLATLQEFHAESWNSELEKRWKDAFDNAIVAMLQGYTSANVLY